MTSVKSVKPQAAHIVPQEIKKPNRRSRVKLGASPKTCCGLNSAKAVASIKRRKKKRKYSHQLKKYILEKIPALITFIAKSNRSP